MLSAAYAYEAVAEKQMTDFFTLNSEGQIARLNTLAREALIYYGLNFAASELMHYTNNAVYRVDAGTHHYVLRLHRPDHKHLRWIRSELAWLGALRRDTDLLVPYPAAPVYEGHLEGVESPVYCVLFRWIDGQGVTPSALTLEQTRAIGEFAAKLHHYSAGFVLPEGFERPHLDWEGLFGVNSPYNPGEAGEALITTAQREVITEATEVVREVMDTLDQEADQYGLIHADLIPKNLLFDGDNTVAALDFDDCAFGYYLYDLAPLLLFLKSEPNYDQHRLSLWEGYTSVRPLPDDYLDALEVLIVARHIASIRWIAGNAGNPLIQGRAPEIIASRVETLRQFLQTGKL